MSEALDRRRRKLERTGVIELSRGIPFEPITVAGKTRFEMTNKGPMHRGKTVQDYMPRDQRPRVKAAQSRLDKARAKAAERAEVAGPNRADVPGRPPWCPR